MGLLFDTYEGSVVYKITNKINGYCYIVSTSNFCRRKSSHLSLLKRGHHHSPRLQKDYNEMGKGHFIFEIIEFTTFRHSRESHWAFIYNSSALYNGYLTIGRPTHRNRK